LAGQRSESLGRDVRVVDVRGVQNHLIMELVEPTEQAIGAPLWCGRSRPQDPEGSTIHTLSFSYVFLINFFITLDSMLQKKSNGVEPPLLGHLATYA
jgi:hypothetical protein